VTTRSPAEPAGLPTRWPAIVTLVLLVSACTGAVRPAQSQPISPSVPAASPASAPGSPSPSSPTLAPVATFPLMDGVFASPWYGYTVSYPSGWQTTAGAGPWPLKTSLGHGDPHLDVVRGTVGRDEVRFIGASQALPEGTTIDVFRSWASPESCQALDPIPTPFMVGGATALFSLNGCRSLAELGGLIWDVEIVSGGRGYDFTVDGPLSSAEVAAWLTAIKLEPASAPTGSAAPNPP
jgi:hypothetical protein